MRGLLARCNRRLRALFGFPRHYSIQKRVFLGSLIGAILVFSVTASIGDHLIDLWLVDEFDDALVAKANVLVSLTYTEASEPRLHYAVDFIPDYSAALSPIFFQLWRADGRVLEKSKSLGNADLKGSLDPNKTQVFYSGELPNGLVGRFVTLQFESRYVGQNLQALKVPARQEKLVLTVAVEQTELDNLLVIADSSLALGIFTVILLVMAVIRAVVVRGLRPLTSVQEQMLDFNIHDKAGRLALDNAPVELNSLVDNFNGLMEKIQNGIRREKKFSSDVAHELRTPVAEIRAMTEVALKWPDKIEVGSRLIGDIHDSSLQMNEIINRLLSLARADRDYLDIDYSRVCVDEMLSDAIRRHLPQAEERDLRWDLSIDSGCYIWAGKVELELIINNLIANAIQYCPAGEKIEVRCSENLDQCVFSMSNSAPDLTRSDMKYVFDRLWPKDRSRTSQDHFGLGLSLVLAYVDAMGMQVEAELLDRDIFHIRVFGASSR